MPWFERFSNQSRRRPHLSDSAAKTRHRRLLFERFEDRRVLATAVDDFYVLDQPNATLTVDGLGTWNNDSYTATGPDGYWIGEEWVEVNWYAGSSITSNVQHGTLNQINSGQEYHDDVDGDGEYEQNGEYGLAFTYTPDLGFVGIDTFTYTLADGNAGSYSYSIAIVIIRVNSTPVANDDSYATAQNNSLTVAAPGVLANDTDSDGNPVTALVESQPAHGELNLLESGQVVYAPDEGSISAPTALPIARLMEWRIASRPPLRSACCRSTSFSRHETIRSAFRRV